MADFPQGVPDTVSPLSQTVQQMQPSKFSAEFDANHRGSSTLDGGQNETLRRADSSISHSHADPVAWRNFEEETFCEQERQSSPEQEWEGQSSRKRQKLGSRWPGGL